MTTISFETHNHKACLKQALKTAEDVCQQQGGRLTELRRTVLELVWNSHEPVKAYDLLERLKQVHPGSQPPTVYRALDFLRDNGLIHKIESLNAYLGCGEPQQKHHGHFLICQDCGAVAEVFDKKIQQELERLASGIDFKINHTMLEIQGSCSNCQ